MAYWLKLKNNFKKIIRLRIENMAKLSREECLIVHDE
jgi:hypothetical protein